MPQFHITVWPQDVMEVPPVVRFPAHVREDGFIELDLPDQRPPSAAGNGLYLGPPTDDFDFSRQIPDELYLRELRDLDLSSLEDIARFCSEYGSLGGRDWTDMVPADWAVADSGRSDVEWYREYAKRNFPELKKIALKTVEQADWGDSPEQYFHPAEFRIRANMLLDVSDILLCLFDRLAFDEVVSHWRSAWTGTPATMDHAVSRYLIPVLNHGMKPFHPKITLQDPEQRRPKPLPPTTVYSALCLQMANHLKGQTVYHVCANESCGRLFVHQRGEAETKKETGVFYCTKSCSRAQAQRVYRRRLASKTNATGQEANRE